MGNLKPSSLDPKDKPAPFEFSFEGLSDDASKRGFSIEPMKGTVEAGGTKEVLVSFAPNPDAVRGSDRTRTRGIDARLAPRRSVARGARIINSKSEKPEVQTYNSR